MPLKLTGLAVIVQKRPDGYGIALARLVICHIFLSSNICGDCDCFFVL